MRILGLDPGSRVTGYGIIEQCGGHLCYIDCGTVRACTASFPERLREIFEGVRAVVGRHGPTEVAVEAVFMHRNADSALKLGQARGAAICAALAEARPVYEYAAREVKLALVGKGGADKLQVQYMARLLLGLGKGASLPLDASDALAVAICHAHHRRSALQERAVGAPPGGKT